MPLTTSGRPDECRTGHFKLQTDLARRARNVFGSGALLAVDHVEFNRFAVVQGLEAAPLDRGVVNEAILLAAFRRDEAEALVRIEPLDCSFHTHTKLLLMMSCCGRSSVRACWRQQPKTLIAWTPPRRDRQLAVEKKLGSREREPLSFAVFLRAEARFVRCTNLADSAPKHKRRFSGKMTRWGGSGRYLWIGTYSPAKSKSGHDNSRASHVHHTFGRPRRIHQAHVP